MDSLRKGFDNFYDLIKPYVFKLTAKDPEIAHHFFVGSLKLLYSLGLAKAVLDFDHGYSEFEISNAAGFNKNGEIPPQVLKYLGFQRVVVGTVTGDEWPGNPRPRIMRFPELESMVNWMGLPGEGAERVAERLDGYGNHGVPITVNLMATPGKKGDEALRDIERTTRTFRDLTFVDRYELNPSCPNTHASDGSLDARRENRKWIADAVRVIDENLHPMQLIYVKESPDLDKRQVEETLELYESLAIDGIVLTNTSREHTLYEKGGLSGNALYEKSLDVQKLFIEAIKKSGGNFKIIACGGISSRERALERISNGASEIQIYTPLIFRGTRLLRELSQLRQSS